MTDPQAPRTLILGGGIAAVEALLALADLAGDRTSITLVSPQPDLVYKPLTVEEPFSHQPAEHRELEPIVAGAGGELVRGAVASVAPDAREVALEDGTQLRYDYLVVCVGAEARGEFEHATTFRAVGEPLAIDPLIDEALADPSRRLAFVVPHGVTWSLPVYELALMSRRRAEESGRGELRIAVVTPESAPLALFGSVASAQIAEVLAARKVEFVGESRTADGPDGIHLVPGDRPLEAGAVIALPGLHGRRIQGLPADADGFIPIDDHARIAGLERAYAAGDGTNFPIKQGGLASQQADAAAAHIAHELGAEVEPEPFHPVLRGQLIVGEESLNLRHDVTGGHGEGTASLDYLWWPPHKVGARYLAALLATETLEGEPPPPATPLDVELSLPRDWHLEPMALDPYDPIRE